MWNRAKGHWGWLFAWLSCVLVLSIVGSARADDGAGAIRVCVRPGIVPAGVAAWVFTANADSVVLTIPRTDFKKQAGGLTVYVYDPFAPPESVKLLPRKFSSLVCPPPPAPVKPPEPEAKKDPPKAEDKKSATGGGTVTADPKKKDAKKKDEGDEPPPGTPPPIVYPQKGAPLPPLVPPLPKGGVTEHWPHTLLPIRNEAPSVLPNVASGHGVLPIAGLDSKGTVLPMVGTHRPPGETEPPGKGASTDSAKPGTGVQKTAYEKACEQIALAGGLTNLQLGEDIHRKDGSRYGIPGGRNPNGIKSPTAQAVAGAVLVTAAVITAGGFDKKLYDALRKGAPMFIQGSGKAAEQAADKLIEGAIVAHGKHGAEDLAAALAKNNAIGEYSVMARFTKGLGSRWQAHHLLEKSLANEFKLGATDRIPSVILSEAEHKALTAKLAGRTKFADTPAELWEAYKLVYKDHPTWLAAIEPYFKNK